MPDTPALTPIIQAIEADIKKMIEELSKEAFSIYCYGAYEIDPKHLAFCIVTKTDEVKKEILENKNFMKACRKLLDIHTYPEKAKKHVGFGVESEETIQRESGGNWYYHFK